MRLSTFLIITLIGVIVLAGCTKIESPEKSGFGIRFGFVEKKSSPTPSKGEAMHALQEPKLSGDTDISTNTSPEPKAEPIKAPEPAAAQEPPANVLLTDVQNGTEDNWSVVSIAPSVNATNETSQAAQEPAVGPNTSNASSGNLTNSSEDQLLDDAPLGFEIRIDANRYYQSGAVRCHDRGIPQCVHIPIGKENCTTDCHFDPEAIMVPVGTTIEWGNHDTAVHRVIASDGSFASATLERIVSINGTNGMYTNYTNSHFSFSFNTPGEYRYRGEDGSSLTGVVVVVTSLS